MDFEENGTAWLASSDGLYRYDGYDWKRFGIADGLPSDFVRSVLVAPDGRIWVGTDRGVAVGAGGQFEQLPTDGTTAGPSVRRIRASRNGDLWFCSDRWPDASRSGGLARLSDGKWTRFGASEGLPDDYIVDFFEDAAGQKYVVSRQGLAIWKDRRWTPLIRQDRFPDTEWQSASIAEIPDGPDSGLRGVWVATGRHLFHVRDGRPHGVHALKAATQYGVAELNGRLLLSVAGPDGLRRFAEWNGTKLHIVSGGFVQPASNFLEQILEAPDGSVWTVGWNAVVRWLAPGESWVEYPELPRPKIVDQSGRIWFSEENTIVVRAGDGEWLRFDGSLSNPILDSQGNVWAIDRGAVIRWQGLYARRFSPHETGMANLRGIAADGQGVVWVYGSSSDGTLAASAYDGSGWTLVAAAGVAPPERFIVCADRDRGIWLLKQSEPGSDALLVHFRRDGVQTRPLRNIHLPIFDSKFLVDRRGRIWLFGNSGLARVDGDGNVELQETPGKLVFSGAEIGDAAWFASFGLTGGQSGLSRFNGASWQSFELPLQSGAWRENPDELLFGGDGEIYSISARSSFLPMKISLPVPGRVGGMLRDSNGGLWVQAAGSVYYRRADPRAPDTRLTARSEPRVLAGSTFHAEFASISLFRPARSMLRSSFSWRTDGAPWSEFEYREELPIRTDGLRLGSHKLEVRAHSEDGAVDPTPAVLEFSVVPVPIQNRPWFLPAVSGVLMGFAALGYLIFAGNRRLARAQAELLALRSRERVHHSQVLEGVHDAVITTDREGIIQTWNAGAERTYGYATHEMIGRPVNILSSSEGVPFFDAVDLPALARGDKLQQTTKSRRGDGVEIVVDLRLTALRDETGMVRRVIGCSHDITDRIRSEEERHAVEQRMREVQKMEALGTLAGGIAHDFNNLLTPMLGFVELAQENSEPTSPVRGYLDEVIAAGRRATELVRQILSFSRGAPAVCRPIDIAEPVNEAVGLLRSSLPSTVRFALDINGQTGAVVANSTQIHQVVMNLGMNAYQAMGPEGGLLEIKIEPVEIGASSTTGASAPGPGTYARLTVRDDGPGMDPAVAERIFDPSFTTKEPGRGTGLGLSVAHGIVAAHGGAILVQSEPGLGSSFEVYLPIIEGAAQSPEGLASKETGWERILLVDDDESVARFGKEVLEPLGYRVTTATDPSAALELFRTKPDDVDVLVTDTTMPHLDGLELIRHVRRIRPQVAVVIVTGFSEMINPDRLRQLGLPIVVSKPYSGADLSGAIRRAAERSKNNGSNVEGAQEHHRGPS